MADPIADDAEQGSDECSDIGERCKDGQQQHRSGLDEYVPAQNKRLHLERPGGEQIGGPLEPIIFDAEGSERGTPRRRAQDLTPRFIAFHPALFLLFREKIPARSSFPRG
jgi:hypothetical protein